MLATYMHAIRTLRPRFPMRSDRLRGLRALGLALALVLASRWAHAADAPQKTFPSPEAGVAALIAAVRSDDAAALRTVLGPGSGDLLETGDAAADRQNRAAFLRSYEEAHAIARQDDSQAVLTVGRDQWPWPIPLVKTAERWRFDLDQGQQEILARRIGRHELEAMDACLAIAQAERAYAARDWDGDGVLEYAARLSSSPGKKDGLYWEGGPNADPSPMGAQLAWAGVDGSPEPGAAPRVPYHGYLYRILTRQGRDAPGGARDYVVNGKMTGGFAALGYPAQYGVSGVMSFVVNQDGLLYEKNLGGDTAQIAARMSEFDPDPSWTSSRAHVPGTTESSARPSSTSALVQPKPGG